MTPPNLKAAALVATKGEWRFSRDKAGVICDTVVEHNGRSLEIRQSIVQAAQYGNRHNDMAFIIAASPANILALLERLQVAEDAAKLGDIAMRFVDRAGDVHPGIDDAETICREFHDAMSDAIAARRLTP